MKKEDRHLKMWKRGNLEEEVVHYLLFNVRIDGAADDANAVEQLLLVDDQRRGEADDVAVGGFGQQAAVAQPKTYLPSVELCFQHAT